MTAPETSPGICPDCKTPSLLYKGSVHGWRCRACVQRYLDAGAARFAAVEDRIRARRLAKLSYATPMPMADALAGHTSSEERR